MPHISTGINGDIFVVWFSTDPPNNINAQLRISGKQVADPSIPAGVAVFTSPTFYSGFRWGDYQSVSMHPLNPNVAFVVGETIIDNTPWGSHIGLIGF